MPAVLHPYRLKLSRPAKPRRRALMGFGDAFDDSLMHSPGDPAADPAGVDTTALQTDTGGTNAPVVAPASSSAWDWSAIANITGAVAKLGGAGASVYIANQNQKAQAAQIQQATLQSRIASAAGSIPSWVLPVALGGGALLLLMAMTSKKSSVVFMPTPAKT